MPTVNLAATTVNGKFQPDNNFNSGGGNIQLSNIYQGYVLRADYLVPTGTSTGEPDGGGVSEMGVAMRDTVVVPANMGQSVQCNLAPDGSFSFVLPMECVLTEPVDLQLRAPDGTQIWSLTSSRQTLAGSNFWNWIANPLIYASLSYNPDAQGEMRRLRGKVIDLQGTCQVAHRQVIIWGQSAGQNTMQPVGLAETDANGNFFCEYPAGHFDKAAATISGTNAESTNSALAIDLIADPNNPSLHIFPTFVFLVVTEVKEAASDCGCNGSKVPRCPDASDLHDNADTYSQDIGGACVNMTTPNRSLEEFSYYMVVRTTEPQIKGMTLNNYEIQQRGIQQRSVQSRGNDEVIINIDENAQNAVPNNLLLRAQNIPPDVDINAGYSDRTVLDANNGADWDYTPTIYQAVTIAHGHILQYKQTWKADGYSLGDLLFSLPLAPGQKKQIAIFDWDRNESATRTEDQQYEESLDAYLSHDRDISEITHTALQESMTGGSKVKTRGFGGGLGIGAMVPLEGVMLGVSAGLGGSVGVASSTAWQNSARNISANTLQNLQENIMQSASAVRSQRTTVVQTVNQGESFRVETDSVANYNHCHALTMEYFEILRHFCVEQKLASVQECLFVPLQMSLFDEFKVLRWKESLKKAIAMRFGFNPRKNSLLAAFDAMERFVNERDATAYNLTQYPVGTYAAQTILDITGEMEITFRLNRPKDKETPNNSSPSLITYQTDVDTLGIWAMYCFLFGKTPSQIKADYFDNDARTQAEKNKIFERDIAPRIANEFIKRLIVETVDATGTKSTLLSPSSAISIGGVSIGVVPLTPATKLDLTQVGNYKREVRLRVTIRSTSQAIGLRRNQIDKLLINTVDDLSASEPMSRATVNSLTLRYRTAQSSGFLCKEAFVQNDLAPGDGVAIFCPLNADEMRNPKMEDWLASSKLLQHLNANLESYHHTIWYNMSADRRYMILDGYIAPNSGGKSVASVVENRLIGIVGNNLILPVAPGYKLDPTYSVEEDKPVTLFQHYEPLTPLPPYRVSVPTRGVFAEAIQGACNSCEKIDNTRFWKWEEHPIPDNPTAINPINTPTPVVTNPDLSPTQMPNPIINIQNAPSVPDPQGYNNMLQVLGTKGLFDNITGLDQNQKNALESMISAQNAAQNYAQMASQLANATAQYKLMEDMKQNVDNDASLSAAEKKEKKGEIGKVQLDAFKGLNNKSANFANQIADYQKAVETIDTSNLSPEIKQQLQQRLADAFMPPSKEQNAESLLSKGLSGFENLSEVKVQTGDGTSMELKGDSVEGNSKAMIANIIKSYSLASLVGSNIPFLKTAYPLAATISDFIALVQQIENTITMPFAATNTNKMFTAFRKIFYGADSWDENLIKGVQDINNPFGIIYEQERERKTVKLYHLGGLVVTGFDIVDIEVYPKDSSGNKPDIYLKQELSLEQGIFAGKFLDIGHVFAGVDAFNHPNAVSKSDYIPLRIDSNLDAVTWVGDLGSIMAEVLMESCTKDRDLTPIEAQTVIDKYAPAQDMLGNVDAYIIADKYNVGTNNGMKVSEILEDYYLNPTGLAYQMQRFQIFATKIGLVWDNNTQNFSNYQEKLSFYSDQINDAAMYYIGAGVLKADNNKLQLLDGLAFGVGVGLNSYSEILVDAMFKSLRVEIIRELN